MLLPLLVIVGTNKGLLLLLLLAPFGGAG